MIPFLRCSKLSGKELKELVEYLPECIVDYDFSLGPAFGFNLTWNVAIRVKL